MDVPEGGGYSRLDVPEGGGILSPLRVKPGVEPLLLSRRPGTKDLGAALATVLDFKDEAHYGTTLLGSAPVRRLIKGAAKLVAAAVAVVR